MFFYVILVNFKILTYFSLAIWQHINNLPDKCLVHKVMLDGFKSLSEKSYLKEVYLFHVIIESLEVRTHYSLAIRQRIYDLPDTISINKLTLTYFLKL